MLSSILAKVFVLRLSGNFNCYPPKFLNKLHKKMCYQKTGGLFLNSSSRGFFNLALCATLKDQLYLMQSQKMFYFFKFLFSNSIQVFRIGYGHLFMVL